MGLKQMIEFAYGRTVFIGVIASTIHSFIKFSMVYCVETGLTATDVTGYLKRR